MLVDAIGWIGLGLITGLVAGKLVNKRGGGIWRDVSLGLVGAVAVGWILTAIDADNVKGFHVWSHMLVVGGAAALLTGRHLFMGAAGVAGLLLMAWDVVGGSAPRLRDDRNNKEQT